MGLPPEIAWPYLKRVGDVVLPEALSERKTTAMTGASTAEVYYDPFDFDIDDDPYPIWKRLRDEAPLYHNEKYNFYALSRYEDVSPRADEFRHLPVGPRNDHGHHHERYRGPARGHPLRGSADSRCASPRLLSKVFTPRRMEAIEPLTRAFCVRALDPLVGSGGFDFIENLGAMVPMRTIGYLLGIPEDNQEAIRDTRRSPLTLKEGTFRAVAARLFGAQP